MLDLGELDDEQVAHGVHLLLIRGDVHWTLRLPLAAWN
jgi:hypothetical protein